MDLERLYTNNPAMTVPSSADSPLRNRSGTKHRTGSGEGTNATTYSSPDRTLPSPTEASSEKPVNVSHQAVSKHDRGWRRIVRNFSPSWFSTTMGTGIVSIILITIPFQHQVTYYLSIIFFLLNLSLFSLASIISTLRYALYPEIWTVMIHDPTNSLFLGTVPMGFATLVSAFISICTPQWGTWATYLAFSTWIIDSIASIIVTLSLSLILISQTHLQSLDRITAAQLLPIAATIVASGTGAKTAHSLIHYTNADPITNPDPLNLALGTLITSYIMWGMSMPFALVTLVIYYQRLTIHKLPPREIIVSSFLPLGPLGMGGFTITYLGAQARTLLPLVSPFLSHVAIAGDILYITALMTALILWSFGIVWFVYAIAAIYMSGNFPFNMGWWGFTFPLGVFALSTIQLGIEFPSLFFRVLGTVFGGMVCLLWVVVALGTVKGAWSGELFYAPCLKNLPGATTAASAGGGGGGTTEDLETDLEKTQAEIDGLAGEVEQLEERDGQSRDKRASDQELMRGDMTTSKDTRVMSELTL